ncbi:MAG: discoidin domain-containing protein [Sandaracinaceae bacterium]|nr:discoidin domain-containing protein [Sandaracinaceae bacterium]
MEAKRSPFAPLIKWFWLRESPRQALSHSHSEEITRAIALAEQKWRSSQVLWLKGHGAEAMALLRGSFHALCEGVAKAQSQSTDPDQQQKEQGENLASKLLKLKKWLENRGRLENKDTLLFDQVLDALGNAFPRFDRELSPDHAEQFHVLSQAAKRWISLISSEFPSVEAIRIRRLKRLSGAFALLFLAALGLAWLRYERQGLFASASDFFDRSPYFAPEMAIDGSPTTSWLLPNAATGWLEISFSPPRNLRKVRLINASNPPWNDRKTREYRLEFYSDSGLVHSLLGTFEWSSNPSPVEHSVELQGIERVRFVVRSHYHAGGGIAEIEFD